MDRSTLLSYRLIFITILGFMVLLLLPTACSNQPEEKSPPKLSEFDSLMHSLEEQAAEFQKENLRLRSVFRSKMAQKHFKFACTEDCDEGKSMDPSLIEKHGVRKLFDIKQNRRDDSLYVDFKFIQDCCLEFGGDVDLSGDTLKLSLSLLNNTACDCHCLYVHQFSLPLEVYPAKYILLQDSLMRVKR